MSSLALASSAVMVPSLSKSSQMAAAAVSVRYRKRISAQEARLRIDRMHPKERRRVDAFIRTGSVTEASRELAENRRTITASYQRYKNLLSDLWADSAGEMVPCEID